MADGSLGNIRALVKHLMRDKRPDWQRPAWEETVAEWFTAEPDMLAELRMIGRPESGHPTDDRSMLQDLYALDRLTDLMIIPWSPPTERSHNDHPTQAAWLDLIELIGAVLIAEDDYHPFFHEIVEVLPDDDPYAAPVLLEEHWPGAMLGSMLLKRAGVTVMAGHRTMDPEIAARSTLYWAWLRRTRRTMDLSAGWGSGSQWRTDFRRDYVLGDGLHYNVDGRSEASWRRNPEDHARVMLELVRYRHGLLIDHGPNQLPWDVTFVERRR